MPLDPDHGYGLLRSEDHEKMELILSEHSHGFYGAPELHGMLTASVVGPESAPIDQILQRVLSSDEAEAIDFEKFDELRWALEKTKEMHLRILRVFSQDPELFRLLVYMPKLKEGDTTPDPQTWCNGFVEGMAFNRDRWAPLFSSEFGFAMLVPILMTSDPDEWANKDFFNPLAELAPLELCECLKTAVLAIYTFWSNYDSKPTPSRASKTLGRNDPCLCGSGKKYKRCCGRSI
jgi:uncharacterized protein